MRLRLAPLVFAFLLAAPTTDAAAKPSAAPRLATLPIPGPARFVRVARDVLDVRVALAPNLAADAGLADDAARAPSWSPATVAAYERRLRADLDALRALSATDLPVDTAIDVRWVAANAEEALQRLTVEKLYERRPAEWLEPLANTLLALATYAPERVDLRVKVAAQIPAMVTEMRAVCVRPTARDVTTALGLVDGLEVLLGQLPAGAERDAASAALHAWKADAAALTGLPEYGVVGADAYATRLRRAMLLPWTPDELLAHAEAELARVDAELATIDPTLGAVAPPTEQELAAARALDRAGLLGAYEDTVSTYLATLRRLQIVTVPADFPPIRARETPEAMIPLTGDGGSMNPPPLFGPPGPAWWNVEHFREDWTLEQRTDTVLSRTRPVETGMATYAAHEGVPGHHLQLALARNIANPIRTLLTDYAAVEGWALYAEEWFWEHGGFGQDPRARRLVLRSYRGRVRRVFYDVNVESGRWTLEEAAAWKYGAGEPRVDPDILRAIQWPAQLVGYFSGKAQIVALREEVRRREGAAWDERAFHDALLAEGLVPLALVRAKMLGEPIPPL